MKKLLIGVSVFFTCGFAFAQNSNTGTLVHSPENSYCFNCHGNLTYSYFNHVQDKNITKRMNPYYIIDSGLYYLQNHKSFECIDCHSFDYKAFPHSNDLQMDQMPVCIDCHEGDEATAKYNFEKIEVEFKESVHSTKHSDAFSCWMCHNPHSYKFEKRSPENIRKIIMYDNDICLSCHANVGKYQLISSRKSPNIIEKHDWLPNQIAHFEHVRCIECHTSSDDDLLVAHKILSKAEAVRKCTECHSENSILMASLYKFQKKESRDKFGFFNANIISSSSYVIGANRNYYLNIASWIIFGLIIFTIIIHFLFKFFSK